MASTDLSLLLLLPSLCLLHIPAIIVVNNRNQETVPAALESGDESEMDDPKHFDPGHADRVTVVDTNSDGSRLLTGSIDHKIKIWNINRKTGERTLHETITAHDAYIIDAKFTSPLVGSYIGSIGADLCFKVWEEEVNHAPNSGRRFKNIATIPSTPRVPFTSFDFRTVDQVYTYLALIDRQGLLSIYEPSDPDNLGEWTLLDQFHVCSPIPNRGDETSFKLCFDQNMTPLSYMNSLSDDNKQLGILVSSFNEVKLYHATADADIPSSHANENGASHRLTFHECLRLPTHPALIRSIGWAPSNIRGTERIATCCKDGSIRVFEIAVEPAFNTANVSSPTPTQRGEKNITRNRPPQQSSLTSAITGRPNTSASSTPRAAKSYVFPFVYQIEHISTLSAHGDAWTVTWDRQGITLMTGGNDGITKLWKKSIPDGKWLLFAEHSVQTDEGEE